jgi:hypothetical protein
MTPIAGTIDPAEGLISTRRGLGTQGRFEPGVTDEPDQEGRAMQADPSLLQLEIFSVLQEFAGGDPVHREAIRAAFVRSQRLPASICGACDYEFDLGEAPELLYIAKPKAEAGWICEDCALLAPDALVRALGERLRIIKPGMGRAPAGNA